MAFRRGKQPSRDIHSFEQGLEYNLLRLCADLNTGIYEHGGYHHRIVNEKKRRDIAVANVRDRVVHRLLYDYLVPLVDPRLDYDVWSCRQGKGLHEALKRTHQLLHIYSHGWVWRADISKFFDHIDHTVLKEGLLRFTSDKTTQELLDKVLGSYMHNEESVSQSVSHGRGIPIGNLTSQIFANIYLNEFDRFMRHTLKPLGYVRYGDDFVLFLRNETDAREMQAIATKWLVTILKLQVHRKNNVILPAKAGLHFLGHTIYPDSPLAVDRTMIRKIERDIDYRNFASYRAMALPKRYAKQLPWRIID